MSQHTPANLTMNSQVLSHFLNADVFERSRLAGSLRQHVTNDGFTNLFGNLDVNDINPKNKHSASSIHFICGQLKAYNGIPDLQTQVKNWLNG